MGKGSHGKKFFVTKRREHEERRRVRHDLDLVFSFLKERGQVQKSNFVQSYGHFISGDIPVSNVPYESGICIKAEDIEIEKGPIPKDPDFEDMASYLKRYCGAMKSLFPKEYCAKECPINDLCGTLDIGNFSFDAANILNAFYRLRSDYRQ